MRLVEFVGYSKRENGQLSFVQFVKSTVLICVPPVSITIILQYHWDVKYVKAKKISFIFSSLSICWSFHHFAVDWNISTSWFISMMLDSHGRQWINYTEWLSVDSSSLASPPVNIFWLLVKCLHNLKNWHEHWYSYLCLMYQISAKLITLSCTLY